MGLFSKKHSIGKTIAELRKAKGWTQVELAEKLQVSDKAVSKWEKDSAFPSVEFFPAIAELFGVSIDYLMTGKAPETEIIVMSKVELCAKNDDVKLFGSIDYEVLKNKDESGKTILDYMLQYDSKKVVDAFFKKYSAKFIFENNYMRTGCINWYSEKVLEILIINNKIDELDSIGAFSRDVNRMDNGSGIFSPQCSKLILTHPNVSKELKMRCFRTMTGNEINSALCFAVNNNNDKDVSLIWDIICEINNQGIKAKQKKEKEVAGRYMTSVQYSTSPCKEHEAIGTSDYYKYFVVELSASTVQTLLDKGYIDIAKKANDYNKIIDSNPRKRGQNILSEEKIQAAELKKSGGSSEQIKTLSVLKDGIVQIDKLLETKDLKFAKSILKNYPIHRVEIFISWFKKKAWKDFFTYAIDNNKTDMAGFVTKKDTKAIEAFISDSFKKTVSNFGYPSFDGKLFELRTKRITSYKPTISEIEDYLDAYKEQVISDFSYQLEKEKTIKDLTKDFFVGEMKKGNFDIVVVKLCVRFEAILKSDFHYTGDFSSMLNSYCSRFETRDDEANNYDPYTPNVLNKLRMHRNGIVHSDKKKETLSIQELEFCINHICGLGG